MGISKRNTLAFGRRAAQDRDRDFFPCYSHRVQSPAPDLQNTTSMKMTSTITETKMDFYSAEYQTDFKPEPINQKTMSTATESAPTSEAATPPPPQGGLLWRIGSGVVGTAAGAAKGVAGYGVGAVSGVAGYGVGAVKWTASKGYDVGAAVASKIPVPPIPGVKKAKDKSD